MSMKWQMAFAVKAAYCCIILNAIYVNIIMTLAALLLSFIRQRCFSPRCFYVRCWRRYNVNMTSLCAAHAVCHRNRTYSRFVRELWCWTPFMPGMLWDRVQNCDTLQTFNHVSCFEFCMKTGRCLSVHELRLSTWTLKYLRYTSHTFHNVKYFYDLLLVLVYMQRVNNRNKLTTLTLFLDDCH